ncbi:MAG: XrtA/PEP-CTERM system histidine kinase PrsK [Pseudomonadota bacterium]
MSVTSISYAICGSAFLLYAIYLLRNGGRAAVFKLQAIAAFVTALWAGAEAAAAGGAPRLFHFLELYRGLAWILVLVLLLKPLDEKQYVAAPFRRVLKAIGGLFLAILALDIYLQFDTRFVLTVSLWDVWAMEYIVLAIAGLILLEQLLKNSNERQRWSVKFYFIGLGTVFCYDLVMYSDALLFKELNPSLWDARGVVNALVVPLLVLATSRGMQQPNAIQFSRQLAFHSASMIGAGIYLLALSTVGYYLRTAGGATGIVLQVVFLALGLMMLMILLFSDQLRAKVRVFIAKHFYPYRYDYRTEWLRFMQAFSGADSQHDIGTRAIEALARIIDCSGGALWVKDGGGRYVLAAHVGTAVLPEVGFEATDAVTQLMRDKDWVIDLKECKNQKDDEKRLELPDWLRNLTQARLLVPLMHHDDLYAILLLKQPRADIDFNWEDRDLLKTAGRQAAGYLALVQTTQSLFEARQFEAFNRLSAYVVHDLKNVVAQLSLVMKNAEKHRSNPAFIDDAFATVDNAVNRMTKMLSQLRKDRGAMVAHVEKVNVAKVLAAVCQHRGQQRPVPQLIMAGAAEACCVKADTARLHAVLEHIVQNAQEATADDGWVKVDLASADTTVTITVSDNGCGMDQAFIRDRLFKPFDTTKGNAGMGIGVYEAREYIQGLGGKITVDSIPGQGTSFIIALPACLDAGSLEARADFGGQGEKAIDRGG